MRVIGIIAEYNPFHNGHIYQIDKIKELYPDSLIIAIISTNFTQRGELSIINKWDKTKICLNHNIDLVVELPTLYATQAADMFAYGAVSILNSLKIDTLVFGTESDNLDELISLAKTQINNKEYDNLVKTYLESGINYPTAMSKAIYDITKIKIDKPNDLLALSYIKEIIKNKLNIIPLSIKRTNNYHGKVIDSNIINASLIRELINDNKDVSNYIPTDTKEYLNKNITINNAFNLLKYQIFLNQDKLSEYLSVDEGIEGRIIKCINSSTDWLMLVNSIKTKRYTYNKISRMLIHILLSIKKSNNTRELYLRILGFNGNGRKYLNTIKKELNIPIYTNYKPNKNSILDLEFKSTYVYSLITNDYSLIEKEYKNKPIIK